MLLRILKKSFLKRPKGVILVLASITLGSAIATAFLGIHREISAKMAKELRSYGANIVVEPVAEGGSLREEELPKIKTVFWKHNITGIAPYLFGAVEFEAAGRKERAVLTGTWFSKPMPVEGEEATLQGVAVVSPWWNIAGEWPKKPDEAVIGAALARRLVVNVGDGIIAHGTDGVQRFSISGIVKTGGYEEDQLFAPLVTVQSLLHKQGKVSRLLVSALTVPIDDFGRRDPATMSKDEYDKWYCTAYVTSVAKNIEEAMTAAKAKPIWQIAGAEGAILNRLSLLMLILTIVTLAAAAIGVSTSLVASISERQQEVALMKAMGADRLQILTLFLGEAAILALVGGSAGYFLGNGIADFISARVFNSTLASPTWLLAIALMSAMAIALMGSLLPLRRALVVEPVKVLKG